MTRDEILAMKAGRELDALVHRHVLGKKCTFIKSEPDDTLIGEGPVGFTSNFGGKVFTADHDWLVDDYLDEETNRELEHYSETWEGMRLVVEAIKKMGWRCIIRIREEGGLAQFYLPDVRVSTEIVRSASAPHAVALAALLSKEGMA